MPDRHLRRIARRIDERLHLRDVLLRRIVERQLAFVAQLQDGDRGEALGHRRDAEDRVGGDRRLRRHVAIAGDAGVRELAVDDHAPGRAGHVRVARRSPGTAGRSRGTPSRASRADPDRRSAAPGALYVAPCPERSAASTTQPTTIARAPASSFRLARLPASRLPASSSLRTPSSGRSGRGRRGPRRCRPWNSSGRASARRPAAASSRAARRA